MCNGSVWYTHWGFRWSMDAVMIMTPPHVEKHGSYFGLTFQYNWKLCSSHHSKYFIHFPITQVQYSALCGTKDPSDAIFFPF